MFLKYGLIFLAGGGVVTAISVLAERGHSRIAGILVLVPAISIISYVFVGKTMGETALREVVLKSFLSVPPLLAFLLSLACMLQSYGYGKSIFLSLIVWLIVAIAIFYWDIRA